MARRLVVGLSCGSLTACTLLSGAMNLGVIDEVERQATVDDGSVAPDAAESTADATTDAPVDVRNDADAALASCAGDFCDSFDDGGLGGAWTTIMLDGGSLAFDTANTTSPPRSLRATIPAGVDNVVRRAYLAKSLPVPAAVTCSFMMRINAPYAPSTRYMDFFQFRATGPQVTSYGLKWGVNAPSSAIREDLTYSDGGCDCPRKSQDLVALPVGQPPVDRAG